MGQEERRRKAAAKAAKAEEDKKNADREARRKELEDIVAQHERDKVAAKSEPKAAPSDTEELKATSMLEKAEVDLGHSSSAGGMAFTSLSGGGDVAHHAVLFASAAPVPSSVNATLNSSGGVPVAHASVNGTLKPSGDSDDDDWTIL